MMKVLDGAITILQEAFAENQRTDMPISEYG